MLTGRVAQGLQEIGRQVESAGDTLNRLDDDGRHIRADHGLRRGTVVARDEVDVERFPRKAVPTVGVPGDGAGRGSAAMKSMGDRENLAATRHRAGHAQRILVGFGTRVNEQHALQGGRCHRNEFLGSRCAHRQRNRVALEQQGFRLFPDCGDESRMAVAQCSDGMAAVEIEDAPAVANDDLAARSGFGHERQLAVDRDRGCRLPRPGVASGCLGRAHFRSSPAGCR